MFMLNGTCTATVYAKTMQSNRVTSACLNKLVINILDWKGKNLAKFLSQKGSTQVNCGSLQSVDHPFTRMSHNSKRQNFKNV